MSNPIDVAPPGTRVTPAEHRALEAVLRNGTVKGAAGELRLSPRTVEHQLATARSRLDVSTTIEALRAVFVKE
jgi:DNA-binding NarL/FixJ family response regulator